MVRKSRKLRCQGTPRLDSLFTFPKPKKKLKKKLTEKLNSMPAALHLTLIVGNFFLLTHICTITRKQKT